MPVIEPNNPPSNKYNPIFISTSPCRQWDRAPDTDAATIWLAEVATATFGGMPINIKSGVIKKPPPSPNIPERKPTAPPSDNISKILTDKHKCIFIESLSNPSGVILDVEKIAKIANNANIPLIVDNTMASPFLFKPIDWGADIVTHSLTKFIGGHGNSMGGIVIESGKFDWFKTKKYPSLTMPTESYHGLIFAETFGDFGYSMKLRADSLRDLGTHLSPTNAFYFINGLETLHLRMERHCENALKIAKFLQKHKEVSWVSYAGLDGNKFNKLAKKLMPNGVGPVFTFGLKGGDKAGKKIINKVKIFSHVANVGDTRSLILHPASTTHNQLSDEQKIKAGAGPEVIRISIGIEHFRDLINDLKSALD